MENNFIFGYGSLVNEATHDYNQAHPADLRGWRREWRYTPLREVAFLSVYPNPASSIQGLIMNVPVVDAALDQRESGYDRVSVSAEVDHPLEHQIDINVFAIPETLRGQTLGRHSLLLSYIDVVVQGYLGVFGEAGVQHFFETTDGWDAPIIDDRAEPIYPRHQPLIAHESELTDHWLAKLAPVVK